jgi:hypothetical protein
VRPASSNALLLIDARKAATAYQSMPTHAAT